MKGECHETFQVFHRFLNVLRHSETRYTTTMCMTRSDTEITKETEGIEVQGLKKGSTNWTTPKVGLRIPTLYRTSQQTTIAIVPTITRVR